MKKILTAVFGFLIVAPTSAQELPLEKYFSEIKSCYGRSYSPAHLDKHPNQRVVDISISHFSSKQELLGMENPNQSYPDTPTFVARLALTIGGQDAQWNADAFCEPDDDRIKCSLECDAGNFYLEERKNGALLMTGGSDLSFDDCDAGERTLMRQPDDKSFLLQPVAHSLCVPPK